MFPCHRMTLADFLSSPLFSSQASPRSISQAKSKPEMNTPDSRPVSGNHVKSEQNEALSPQVKPHVHKGAGFRRTTASDACSEFLPWQATVRKISPKQCTLGRGRAGVFSGIKLPARTQKSLKGVVGFPRRSSFLKST